MNLTKKRITTRTEIEYITFKLVTEILLILRKWEIRKKKGKETKVNRKNKMAGTNANIIVIDS